MAALAFHTPNQVPAPLCMATLATRSAEIVAGPPGVTPAKVLRCFRFVGRPFTVNEEVLWLHYPKLEWESRYLGGEDKGFQEASTKAVGRDGTYNSTLLTMGGKILEHLQGPNPVNALDVMHSIRTVTEKTPDTILVVAQHFALVTIIVPTCKKYCILARKECGVHRSSLLWVFDCSGPGLPSVGVPHCLCLGRFAGKEAKTRKCRCPDSLDSGHTRPSSGDAVTVTVAGRTSRLAV